LIDEEGEKIMNSDTIKVKPKAISDLEYYAAKEAAAHHVGELPDPLWPGHVLEEVRATEPDCAAYRADKLRREAAKVLLRDGSDLSERNAANRCEERRWAPNPYFSIPVALALLVFFAWDSVKRWIGGVL